jgi:anti-sigma B factor antagonist
MKPENLAGVLGSRIPPVLVGHPKRLKLSLEAQSGGAVVLHCQGRIIFGSEARALTDIVAEVLPSARRMVVDLAGVEAIDSAGLGELVLLHMWSEAAGYTLKFASPSASVRRLLVLTNLVAVFDAYGSVAEALAAMHQEEVCSA